MLSPAEPPTLSPAGPSPSPGGVGFSPYGCGVSPAGGVSGCPTISPAGSTAVSPATQKLQVGADGYTPPRCSVASATEMEEEDGCLIMGLSAMGGERPSLLEERACLMEGMGGVGGGRGGGRGRGSLPRLFELADELGGQGSSGLRWSQLAIFDDQVCDGDGDDDETWLDWQLLIVVAAILLVLCVCHASHRGIRWSAFCE